MTAPFRLLDPCLPEDRVGDLFALVDDLGPLPAYVEAPRTDGFGAGLTRRHDALMNYVQGKMAGGDVPSMEEVSARTNLFRGVLAEGDRVHVTAAEDLLYDHGPFLEAARAITGLPVVQPDMLYINVLLPGQELALHTDTPEYRGLSKQQAPEWLLVAMAHSGLFEDWRVRIAGGVSFFEPPAEGGAFVLFPEGPEGQPVRVGLRHNTSVMLDADALFHGVDRVGGPSAEAPPVRPGMTLRRTSLGGWEALDGDRLVASWAPGEVRLSVQWKARCFASEEDRQRFVDGTDALTLDDVLARLEADLRQRGLLTGERPAPTAFALQLIQTYVQFPEEALA